MRNLLIVITLLLTCVSQASAAKQYRCNGKVQYKPCAINLKSNSPYQALSESQRNLVKASYKYQKEMSESADRIFAEVVESSYRKLNDSRNYGQWRGVVRGNGDVHLVLAINKNGKVTNKYMGHVKLKKDQTIFNFISTPPSGKNWNWQVLARAQ